jgi:PAS domain S-box-containing protein
MGLIERQPEVAEEFRLLANVIEGLPMAVAVVDADGHVVLDNRRFRQLFDMNPPSDLRRDPLLASDPTAFPRAFAGERVFLAPEWRTLRSGRIAVRVELARVPLGAYVAITATDVTAELQLADERTRSSTLLEHGADIFYLLTILASLAEGVIATDRDGKVVRMNPAAERLTGWRAESAVGRLLDEVVFLRSDSDAPIVELAERALRGEVRADGGSWVDLVHRQGTRRPIAFDASPLRTRDGRIEGALVVLRDMTETRRAQAELQQSRSFLEEAQAVAHIGSWVSELDRHERLVWSKETFRIFGIGEGQFDGTVQTFFDHVHPSDLAMVEAASEAAIRGEAKYDVTHRIVRGDGEVRWVYQQATVLRDRAGEPLRFVGTVQDITERKEAEEQLLHARKLEAVGRLAGGIAHDFNNLMSVVLSFADILLDKLPSDDGLRPHVEQIRLAGERATQLTRQLLAVGRRQMLQPRVVDLKELVGGMMTMVRRVIGEDIDLVFRVVPELMSVFVDPVHIEQAILNLTLNARDAMPQGGRLIFELANFDLHEDEAHYLEVRPGQYVMLAVSDSGAGMDSTTVAQAFEPYFTTKAAGTGLGLASVHGIVRQSGGTIRAESEPGRGTTFFIYLPATSHPVSEIERQPESSPRDDTRTEGTILLVEDDPQVREVARVTLSSAGFTVFAADTPALALESARGREGKIDLLLTDVVLPAMSGPKLAEVLTAERPGLRVLYMSGYAEDAIVHHGVLDGTVEVIQKPITPGMLLRCVRATLLPRRH